MKDYVSIDIQPNISNDLIHKVLMEKLPDFKWRTGDSDMQGPYISGVNSDNIHVKIWLGERPVAMSVSFASVIAEVKVLNDMKEKIIDRIKNDLLPSLGRIINFNS